VKFYPKILEIADIRRIFAPMLLRDILPFTRATPDITSNTHKTMKLAEALAIRKDTQKRIDQLKSRILNNVRVQEGDKPSEDPNELIKQLEGCLKQLQRYIYLINKTNMQTICEGRTLTELMAEKDVLSMRINALRSVFDKASASQDRYSRSEIKMVTTIDIKALGQKIDDYSKRLRELDIRIQALNFATDLAE